MEQYYEQNVVNHNIDERTKKTKTLNIAKMVLIIIAVFILSASMLFVSDDSFGMMLGILALVDIPFICAAIIVSRINKRNNTEYDYTIDDEYLKITEIYYRERRKLKHSIRLRTIESVGMFDSDGYRKSESNANKKYLAIVNYDDEKSIIYILYNTDKGRRIIFVEPDRGFIIALRRIVSAVTVFDKSMSDFDKILEEKEAEQQ
ncbi:MAG: hypothetical protein K2M48_00475 [Clostridiales bacterium]|nr:hypothetical protein [Clostridiales bacterium]